MAVKKVGSFNIHETPAINQNEFDVETYLNANWEKTKEAVNNNAEELMQAQKDISTLKEDNKTNKSSIDVLEKSNETRDEKISKNTEDIEAIQGSIKTATETINKKDNEQDEDIKANKETIKEIQAENERLREDIKSIATIGEASGENIHLEDSSEARCELEICGNHQQDTREGYNQININDFFEGTRNGVTITKDLEKGSLTFNGTVTSTFAISIPLNLSKGTIISYSLNNSKVNKEVIMRLGIANGQIGGLLCDVVNAKKENFELTEDINEVQIRIGAGITLESFVVFPQLETNTSLHNFEIYGASPSIDYPSKVKSVNGSAKIDIFNKNFIDIDKLKSLNSRNAYEKYNNVECLKLAGVKQIYNLNCKQNTQYVFQVNIVGYTYTDKLIGQFLIAYTDGSTSYMQTDGTNAGKYSLISNARKTVKALVWNGYSAGHFVYIDKNDIQLDEATTLTNIVQHEEQSYLVDVQQPMLEGDKFVKIDEKWYEKHNFDVISTLNKSNIKVTKSSTSTDTFFRYLLSLNAVNRKEGIGLKIYSTHFINKNSRWARVEGICGWESGTTFCLGTFNAEYDTEEKVTNFLQNTDVKIYYELAEPILLECTEAQSKVLDEIYNKAHTYKNITNISAESSEVNPIVNVKYLKDTETEHKKLQAQIDEIKELLSSTETSAMLVNNLEKDLRMEVE